MVKSSSFRVVWDTNALNEFKEILTYLKNQSIQAPKIVRKAVFERIKSIEMNPILFEQDKLRKPSNIDFRAFVVFSFRVTYQIKFDLKEVRILRIRHTSREPLGYK